MFFRFGSAVFLVVVMSLIGIAIEKQNLDLRREISRQHYRMDVLREEHARLRLRSQRLAAIERLFETVDVSGGDGLTAPNTPRPDRARGQRRLPTLFWQRPLTDPRIENRR
jgi:hypothetical protein